MKYLICFIFIIISGVANAAYYCGTNDLQFESLTACSSNCDDTCTELLYSAGTGTCPADYSSFVYDRQTGLTYGVSVNQNIWSTNQQFIADNQHKAEIVNVLAGFSGKSVWLGLYDRNMSTSYGTVNKSNFVWIDGSMLTYDNFADGQPDNGIDGSDIGTVTIYGEHWAYADTDGKWYDDGQHTSYGEDYQPRHNSIGQFSGMLGCVAGLPVNEQTNPNEIINTYCSEDTNNCMLCIAGNNVSQCLAAGSGGYICPSDMVSCDSVYNDPLCPDGGILNGLIDMCQKDPLVICDNGFTYDQASDKCYEEPDCPSGGVLNHQTDQCEVIITDGSCPVGYTYDSVNNSCVKTPDCSVGTYILANDRCEFSVTYTCPTGYLYNSSTSKCEDAPDCPTGFSYSTSSNQCLKTATTSCPTGYTLSSGQCIASPTCPYGTSFNSVTNKCEGSGSYTCPVDNTTYSSSSQCSDSCSGSIPATLNSTLSCSYDVSNFPHGLRNVSIAIDCSYGDFYYDSDCSQTPVFRVYKGSCTSFTYSYSSMFSSVCNLTDTTSVCLSADGVLYWESNNIIITLWHNDINTTYSCPPEYTLYGSICTYHESCDTTCPTGTTQSGSLCIANPTCPSGGTFNSTTDKCVIPLENNCPSGSSYDSALGKCVANATCSSSGTLNTTTDKCTLTVSTSCPSGYTHDGNICYSAPVCSSGIYNSTLNECTLSASTLCPTGYSFNAIEDRCEKNISCPSGTIYSTQLNSCVYEPEHDCGASYSYSPINRKCEAVPICTDSIYNPEMDKCHSGSCPYSGNECVNLSTITGSPDYKCSPHQCLDPNDPSYLDTSEDTQEGANDKLNDGDKDDSGQCLDQIYIFNGGDRRCRKPGTQTGFSDCCKKDETWFGLGECSPGEQALSTLRDWGELDGQCHYVGEYCAEKWGICPACVCVQKKKTYCCFGSPLGRIVAEQGRSQLGFNFGTAKSPNCRGFTPEEFQKLDFSKINFSEWLNTYVKPEMMPNVEGTIINTFENIQIPEIK